MSTQEVPDEAVEVAARGIFNVRDDPYDFEELEDLDSTERELYVCQARAALTAAAPFIAAQAWDEGRSVGIDECAGDLVGADNPYRSV